MDRAKFHRISYGQSGRYCERHRLQYSGDLGTASLASDLLNPGVNVLIKRVRVSDANSREIEEVLKGHCSLRHPHVVELLEGFATPYELNLVLEYPDGGSLWQYMLHNGPLDESIARWFFQQVIVAVHFCHCKGRPLANIRLENVLLKKGELLHIVKLWGFAYSRHDVYEAKARKQEAVLDYSAPEVLDGRGAFDPFKADIYSCGVLLYYMLFNTFPFSTPDSQRLPRKQQREKYLETVNQGSIAFPPRVSNSCRDLLVRLLNPNPNTRISMEEIYEHDGFSKNFPLEARKMNEDILAVKEFEGPVGLRNPREIHQLLERARPRPIRELNDAFIDEVLEEEEPSLMTEGSVRKVVSG